MESKGITWDEMLQKTFSKQIEIEKESILKYNSEVKRFSNHSIKHDEVNIILIYGITDSECFNHIYRMAIYPQTSTEAVYRNGGAIDSEYYNIQNVKDMAKAYFAHWNSKLK